MKRFAISLVVLAVLSAAAPAADKKGGSSGGAHGNSNGISNHNNGNSNNHNVSNQHNSDKFKTEALHAKVVNKDYHLQFGTKYSFGYCFKGFNHCHWTYRCWYDYYGCYCYWCPCTCVWYWWCAQDGCYYPISYRPY